MAETVIQELKTNLNDNNLYIKRDDLTGKVLGGNKTRKLDYFIEDIINKKYDCVVTYGSSESNHCTATAAAASANKLKCVLILAKPDKEPQHNGNYFLYKLFNAEIIYTEIDKVQENINSVMENLKNKGFNPYFVQGGGHGNLGTLAYVDIFYEILQQEKKLNISFDYIFHASGTGTTQAGLIIGNKLYSSKSKEIIGISIARKSETAKEVIKLSINEFLREYNKTIAISDSEILVDDNYIGEGYGKVYPKVIETIKQFALKEQILLDPIYTGKAFYGMCDIIKNNSITNKNILFIHTGGIPILFNKTDIF